MNNKIGFIGLGNVGRKIANNIFKANYSLYVYDLDQSSYNKFKNKDIYIANSISDLISNTSIFITCLPSPKSVDDVIKKALPNLTNKHLWIEMSTTDESEIIRLAKLCKIKGAETIEAPITGGQHRAESGNISVLAAGDRKNFVRALPILKTIGHKILYCGKIGNASTLKVVTNYLASVNLIAIGEALMVSKKYGINLKTAFNAIKISSGNSFVNETESQVILSGSYNVGFTMDLVCKDVGLFQKLTDKFKIPAKMSQLINSIFFKGKIKYGERAFSTSIVKLLEEKCNEDLRSEGFPLELIDFEKKKHGLEIKIKQ